jgi:opacity protein-like surface antigen
MRLFQILALAMLIASLSASPARAEGFITPYIGFNFGGDSANCAAFSNCEEKRTNWGVTFGSTQGIFGIEADFGYAPHFFGDIPDRPNSVFHFMTDFMVLVPAGPIQPYAFIGLGVIRPHATFGVSSLSLDQNAFGHDLGGGLNLFMVHKVGLHGEVRHLRTFKDVTLGVFSNDKLDFWRASAGLTFRF